MLNVEITVLKSIQNGTSSLNLLYKHMCNSTHQIQMKSQCRISQT